jgi:hypothetical protein
MGSKFTSPSFAFGDVGLFNSKKSDAASVWGIFISYGSSNRYLRAYVPGSGMYSKYHFKPQSYIPGEWKFTPCLASTKPIRTAITSGDFSAAPLIQLNSDVQTGTTIFSQELSDQLHEDILNTSSQESASPPVQLSHQLSHDSLCPPSPVSPDPVSSGSPVLTEHIPDAPIVDPDSLSHEGGISGSSSGISDSNPSLSGNPSVTVQSSVGPCDKSSKISDNTAVEVATSSDSSIHTEGSSQSRPRRAASSSSWKDGPANHRDTVSAKHQALNAKAMQSSLRKALQDADKAASIEKSIQDEIGSLDSNALRCVLYKDIPESFRKDIIDTYMFHKEKFKANGEFDKHKCRLVLRSDQRELVNHSVRQSIQSLS